MFAKNTANIICATAMISVFIGIFFFTYASKIERNIVVKRSTEIVDDITSNMKMIIPEDQKQIIKNTIVPYLTIPDSLNKADKDVENANNALQKSAIEYIFIFASVCIVIVFCLSMMFKFSFFEIVEENIIVLVFVAITEYIFLTFFAQNYITIDSNFVKGKMIDTLLKIGSS
jgi:hypothetical protein